MGAFGSSDSIFAKILSPIFGYFGYATEGSRIFLWIYAAGRCRAELPVRRVGNTADDQIAFAV